MFESTILKHLGPHRRNASDDAGSIQTILKKGELQRLREKFDEGVLLTQARSIGKKLPDSKWFVDGIIDQFYSSAAFPSPDEYKRAALQRESQLITLFLFFSHGEGIFLGIHFYWGLMTGLYPEELMQHVMLVGVYGGIELLNTGLSTLARTLSLLKALAQRGEPPPTEVIISELATALGPVMAG